MTLRPGQFHESELLLAFAQGVPGRLVLWVVSSALLAWHGAGVVTLTAFAVVLVDPARKRLWLSVAAAGVFVERYAGSTYGSPSVLPESSWLVAILLALAGIAALFLSYLLAKNFKRWPALARRHPVLAVHAAIWSGLCLSTLPWFGPLGMVPFFAWRLSYLAVSASRGRLPGTGFSDHLFYLVPAWGGTTTPYGKGLDYLARYQADDPLALAKSRLAGLKLLLLALFWSLALEAIDALMFGRSAESLPSPVTQWLIVGSPNWLPLHEAIASGDHGSWLRGWAIIYLELLRATLALAATGHVIIGALRLMGFNVFRNTYKPLLSESILEFWNRYYYYFKELLVDFFFYPTYLRLRGLNPAARMLAAVFAAACLGNMYHHLLADPQHIVHFDPVQLWTDWSPRLVYCILLASGISISMLRQQRLRAARVGDRRGSQLLRWRHIAGVWTFYSLIQIWNTRGQGVGIEDCAAFFLSLFGL